MTLIRQFGMLGRTGTCTNATTTSYFANVSEGGEQSPLLNESNASSTLIPVPLTVQRPASKYLNPSLAGFVIGLSILVTAAFRLLAGARVYDQARLQPIQTMLAGIEQ